MSKQFDTVIEDMNKGLSAILNKIKYSNKYFKTLNLQREKEIQKIKIDFLKKGYNFRDRELKQQTKLK